MRRRLGHPPKRARSLPRPKLERSCPDGQASTNAASRSCALTQNRRNRARKPARRILRNNDHTAAPTSRVHVEPTSRASLAMSASRSARSSLASPRSALRSASFRLRVATSVRRRVQQWLARPCANWWAQRRVTSSNAVGGSLHCPCSTDTVGGTRRNSEELGGTREGIEQHETGTFGMRSVPTPASPQLFGYENRAQFGLVAPAVRRCASARALRVRTALRALSAPGMPQNAPPCTRRPAAHLESPPLT
jgi:hypothetical protein